MKPNQMRRRDVVAGLALIPATSLLPPANAAWKPRFFTLAQVELVGAIAELIIPETETPGARAARVDEYIDLVLSEETPQNQKSFVEGLVGVDRRSRKMHGREFVKLRGEQQAAILTSMQGDDFFEHIRRTTVFGYYTSHIGIHQELNYQGNQMLTHWPGCPHPDHHGDSEEVL